MRLLAKPLLLVYGLCSTAGSVLAAIWHAVKMEQEFIESGLLTFANETASEVLFETVFPVFAANEHNAEKRTSWVQLAPFGRFDNAQGMQVFDREAADAIVQNFANMKWWNSPGAAIMGLPFYIGHPDHPNFKDRYKDTKAYGRIKALEVRENGLFANVKWTREGAELVADEVFHGQSAVWRMQPIAGKSREFRPVALQSVGFTNEPNIPVEPARLGANEKENAMLKQLLEALGIKEGSTEAETLTAVNAIVTAANEMKATKEKLAAGKYDNVEAVLAFVGKQGETIAANETKITEQGKTITTLTTERDTLKGEKATLETNLTNARTAFANERAARAKAIIDGGVKDGRIVEADRAKWTEAFANESTFDAKVTEFGALTPAKSNNPISLGDRKQAALSPLSEAGTQLRSKAEAIAANEKCSWDDAWNKAKAENPALVQAMEAKK